MRFAVYVISLLLLVVISGCGKRILVTPDKKPPAEKPVENVTFAGTIPCADCRAMDLTVTLFQDKTFRLRRVLTGLRQGGSRTEYDLGRWKIVDDRLILDNGDRWPMQFRYMTETEIRMLDQRGNEIVSKLDYSLRKIRFVDIVPGPVALDGLFSKGGAAFSFRECKTGKQYPLLFQSRNTAVEQQYMELRSGSGKPLLATLKGSFVMRKPQAGAPPMEHIVVQQFGRFWPGGDCRSRRKSAVKLTGTYWNVIDITGIEDVMNTGGKSPYLLLALNSNSIKGFTGCNSLMGQYAKAPASIAFSRLATTRMACPGSSPRIEKAFLNALRNAVAWKITGTTLELYDNGSRLLMRLKAG